MLLPSGETHMDKMEAALRTSSAVVRRNEALSRLLALLTGGWSWGGLAFPCGGCAQNVALEQIQIGRFATTGAPAGGACG